MQKIYFQSHYSVEKWFLVGLCRNVFKNSNVHGGFTPATWLPPNAITPEKVITALSHCAGAVRGDRHCPLLQSICPFYFVL